MDLSVRGINFVSISSRDGSVVDHVSGVFANHSSWSDSIKILVSGINNLSRVYSRFIVDSVDSRSFIISLTRDQTREGVTGAPRVGFF